MITSILISVLALLFIQYVVVMGIIFSDETTTKRKIKWMLIPFLVYAFFIYYVISSAIKQYKQLPDK